MRSSRWQVSIGFVAALLACSCAAPSPTPALVSPSPAATPASTSALPATPLESTPPSPVATPVPSPSASISPAITAIVAGDTHTCVLARGGRVRCWGANDAGQLGNGSTTHSSTPVDVSGLGSGVRAISAGGQHTCALTDRGRVQCWGANHWGQLGNGKMNPSSSIPVDVAGLASGVQAVTAGGYGACVLTNDFGVRCWGTNFWGQLGNGTTTGSAIPVDVLGLASGVRSISAGGWHTCALKDAGEVVCWGTNVYQPDCGEGPCNAERSNVPVAVTGLASGVVAIASGHRHTCTLTGGGEVQCWGAALANGSTNESNVPIDVAGLAIGVTAIVGGGQHACAVTSPGRVRCWGINDEGELGDGTTTSGTIPVDVVGLSTGVRGIAAGDSHSCVLIGDDGVKCWGANWRGQLGNGTTTGSLLPVDVDTRSISP